MLVAAGFYIGGFLSAVLLFAILRDRYLDNAVSARERDLYAPTLHKARSMAPPVHIRLDHFTPHPRHVRGAR